MDRRSPSWHTGVDATGSAYVTGETQDMNLPVTAGAFQQSGPVQDGTSWIACRDAFITKLSPDGGTTVHARYLGALQADYGNGNETYILLANTSATSGMSA